MMLHTAKEKAILQWLRCLPVNIPIETIPQLANGKELYNILLIVHPLGNKSKCSIAETYELIKKFLNDFFQTESDTLVDFSGCIKGDEFELAKVLVLLLSAVAHYYLSTKDNKLFTLTHLDNSVQEDIKECLSYILNTDEGQLVKADFNRILSRKAKCRVSPRNPAAHLSPYNTPQQSTSGRSDHRSSSTKTPKAPPKGSFSDNSPLKLLLDSPQLTYQVTVREKVREIARLRSDLVHEENKTSDLSNEMSSLKKDLREKVKEIKKLKGKVDKYSIFQECADDYEKSKALCEENLQEIERLRDKLKENWDLKESNTVLESQNETLRKSVTDLEEKMVGMNQFKTSYHELLKQHEQLRLDFEAKEKESENWKERSETVEHQLNELREQLSVCQDKYENVSQKLKDVEESSEMHVEKVSIYSETVLEELKLTLAEKEIVIFELKNVRDALLEEQKSTLAEKEATIAELKNARDTLLNQQRLILGEKEATVAELQRKLECQKEEFDSREEELHVIIQTLKAEMSAMKSKYEKSANNKPNVQDDEAFQNFCNNLSAGDDLNKCKLINLRRCKSSESFFATSGGFNLESKLRKYKASMQSSRSDVHAIPPEKRPRTLSVYHKDNGKLKKTVEIIDDTTAKDNSSEGLLLMDDFNVSSLDLNPVYQSLHEKLSIIKGKLTGSCVDTRAFCDFNNRLRYIGNVVIFFDSRKHCFDNLYENFDDLSNDDIFEYLSSENNEMEKKSTILHQLVNQLYEDVETAIRRDRDIVNQANQEISLFAELQCKYNELKQKCVDENAQNKPLPDHSAYEEKMENLKDEIQALQDQNRELKSSCEKKQKELETCLKDVTVLNKVVKENNSKYAHQIKTLKQDLEKLRSKYESAKKVIEKLEKSISHKDDLISRYSTQLISYQNKVGNKKNEEKELVEALHEERKCVSHLQSELNLVKYSLAPLQAKVQDLESQLKIQKQENASLAVQLQYADGKLHERKKQIQMAQQKEAIERRLAEALSKKRSLAPGVQQSPDLGKFKEPLPSRYGSRFSTVPQIEIKNEDTSFSSIQSNGLSNKSVLGGPGCFLYNDDEETFLNHSSIAELGKSYVFTESVSERKRELQRRNTLCMPHLKSTYPVEFQNMSSAKISNDSLLKDVLETSNLMETPKRSTASSSTALSMGKRPFFASKEFLSKKLKATVSDKASDSSQNYVVDVGTPNRIDFLKWCRTPRSVKLLRARNKKSKEKSEEKHKTPIKRKYYF